MKHLNIKSIMNNIEIKHEECIYNYISSNNIVNILAVCLLDELKSHVLFIDLVNQIWCAFLTKNVYDSYVAINYAFSYCVKRLCLRIEAGCRMGWFWSVILISNGFRYTRSWPYLIGDCWLTWNYQIRKYRQPCRWPIYIAEF